MRSKSTTRRILAATCVTLALVGCGGPPPERSAAPPPGSPEAVAPARDALGGLVPDGAPWDPAWLDEATVVFVGRYDEDMYPHTIEPDGSHIYYSRQAFVIERVLAGAARLAVPEVVVNTTLDPTLRVAPELVTGRRYLVLLAPDAGSEPILADADHDFTIETQLGADEIVAIVDLEASRHDDHRAAVAAFEQLEAFALTGPDDWAALDAEPGLAPEAVMGALHVLRRDWLPSWCSAAEVEAAIGQPDTTQRDVPAAGWRTDVHRLGHGSPPGDGLWRAVLELRYDPSGHLLDYNETFEQAADGAWHDPGYDAWRAAGLEWTHWTFTEARCPLSPPSATPGPEAVELAGGLWVEPGYNHAIYSHGGPLASIDGVRLELTTEGASPDVSITGLTLARDSCGEAGLVSPIELTPTTWQLLTGDAPADAPMRFMQSGPVVLGFEPVEVESTVCIAIELTVDGRTTELQVPLTVEREEDWP